MINKVVSSSVESKYTPNWEKQPNFTGLGNALLNVAQCVVQTCEKNPMLNVSVIDLSTAIIPRTVIETKESNAFAGMEAFRRESSGLIVNCLIPSFIVMGLGSILQKPIMKGFGKSSIHNIWANSESLDIIKQYFEKASGTGDEKLQNAIEAFMRDLKGIDGTEHKSFADFNLKSAVNDIVKSNNKKEFKAAYKGIADITHMTERLELNGKVLSKNLEGVLDDFTKVGRAIEKEGIKTSPILNKYFSLFKKHVNAKSLAGLAVIIPLAISMQPINRWITAKTSGIKGAPIYKDFTTSTDNNKELTSAEKKSLWRQKLVSVASMVGVMLLSMGKFPGKEAFQFKGIFPTMDQARIISTATFSSRMLAAEDKHELREATIRDIITFSSLYFLGDYAAKGIATLIEKFSNVKLLNRIKTVDKDANIFKKFGNWVKNVNLKSSDEVVGKLAKSMRSVCQLGNFAFSLLVLGLFVPLYTRTQTNKKHEEELKKLAASVNSTNGFLKDQIKNGYPAFKSIISGVNNASTSN